jgi:DNA-binding MarR family transcriptional regulator
VAEERTTKGRVAAPAPPSVAFMVSRLGFEVGRKLADGLAPLGIELRQFGLLRALEAAEGESQRSIGQSLGIPPNGMVALIDDLEERGLVQRRPHPSDRRAHALSLTPKGKQLLQDAFKVALSIEADLCEELDQTERQQLLGLLGKLTSGDPQRPAVHPGLSSLSGATETKA